MGRSAYPGERRADRYLKYHGARGAGTGGGTEGCAPQEVGSMNLFVLKSWIQAKFTNDERGATMVEYALLLALIAVALIAAVNFLSDETEKTFGEVGSSIN
jgi:Flp pilus assembly pilin Flp